MKRFYRPVPAVMAAAVVSVCSACGGRTAVRREPAYPGGTDPGGRTYKRTVPRSRPLMVY